MDNFSKPLVVRAVSSPLLHPSHSGIDIRRASTFYSSFPESLFGPPTARSRSALSIAISKKKSEKEIQVHEEEEEKAEGDLLFSEGLSSAEAAKLLRIHGLNQLPEKTISLWYVFVSLLWQPMPCMIWAAAIIEAGIQNWPDMAILLFIQFANASIGFYETVKAGNAVAALKNSLKPLATVSRDGRWRTIDSALLVPGDLVLLVSGTSVPADCRVKAGQVDVDQSAITGESLPVTLYKNEACKMGSTIVQGEVEAVVEFTGCDTFFGKTASLLAPTEEQGNLTKLLICIVLVLVVLSSVLCVIVFVYVLLQTSVVVSLSFAIVLMVASVPLAIEIVTTTTLALGSKELSVRGAIVARLAAIEDLAAMSILCCDKTGTLTMNQMEIQTEAPIYKQGETRESLLAHAAMATKWKEPAKDALDKLVLNAVDMTRLDNIEQMEYSPFNPTQKRTESVIREHLTDGSYTRSFRVAKGAPHAILALLDPSHSRNHPNQHQVVPFAAIDKGVGESNGCETTEDGAETKRTAASSCLHSNISRAVLLDTVEADLFSLGSRGVRCLAVAKTNEAGVWEMLGMLTFLDPPRPDTKATIGQAIRYGVSVKMITGDHLLIARETASRLGLGSRVTDASALPSLDPETKLKPLNLSRDYGDMCLAADGFAQVFPEHKYLIVECLRELGYKVGMTGDGVNDAPALKRADVGIAVSGATDAARAAADIVLTAPGLSAIIDGICAARRIFTRIRNFFTYRIAATLQLLMFFFVAVFAFKPMDYFLKNADIPGFPAREEPWPPFFHMPVLMIMLITLLNDGTLITIAYDNASPSDEPESWNIPLLFTIAAVMGGVAAVSSLLLLYLLLTSWDQNGAFQTIGIGGLSYGQITTSIYLKISVSDFLTLFSARAGQQWFWETRPARILVIAGAFALGCSTLLACVWPASRPDDIYTLGLSRRPPYALPVYIWIYCLIWWLIQDAAKVWSYYVVKRFNIFRINDSGKLVLPDSTLRYIKEHCNEYGLMEFEVKVA